MECFRQVWRCMKAPFTPKEKVLEIGLPTNFRKEEPPACFSDAESVISPNQTTSERPILTKELQHVHVSGSPGIDNDETRHDNRDDGPPAVDGGENTGPSAGYERGGVKPLLRSLTRWLKTTAVEDHEAHEIQVLDKSVQDASVQGGQVEAALDRSSA
ncbi:hypothetical protein N7466_002097 [Penicillium verhagenii]|uniref:uncharacterized protein n=1 Tax=Penicillium verhagenii TaxID=1562060 RepID=UPI0025450C6F|nr:uncharacterized protein N7466_002097 [Penicillium verhagenii]KAJ5938963.1 hypothetical protein N7466_002097 [Penicillium verhagenii]